LTTYTKIGTEFAERLHNALEDIGTSAEQFPVLLTTLKDSFQNILRLASSITQSKGPASDLVGKYIDALHKKMESIAENVAMANDPDLVTVNKKELLGSLKTLLEQMQNLFADVMQMWSCKGLTYHGAHFLIRFVLRVVSHHAKQITLVTCPALNWQLC
jgi:hypothetical protein